MRPTSHGEHETRLIGAPKGWNPEKDGECGALSVFDVKDERGHNLMISRWELEDGDLDRLRGGAPVYLSIMGQEHPVVCVYPGDAPVADSDQITHAEMVRTLVKPGAAIAATMTADEADLWHGATGVSGEAGELLDAIKKHVVYKKALDRDNIVEELGDLEFYMEQIRQRTGITREETLEANIAKLRVRYEGLRYSDAAAHKRADKVDA